MKHLLLALLIRSAMLAQTADPLSLAQQLVTGVQNLQSQAASLTTQLAAAKAAGGDNAAIVAWIGPANVAFIQGEIAAVTAGGGPH